MVRIVGVLKTSETAPNHNRDFDPRLKIDYLIDYDYLNQLIVTRYHLINFHLGDGQRAERLRD